MLLKFAAKDFLDDREFKNVSPTTLDRYTRILAEFQDFCAKDEIVNVEDVSANIVKKYLTDCHKRGNKSTTVNTKLRGLKAFFNYMVECEVITEKRNPTTIIVFLLGTGVRLGELCNLKWNDVNLVHDVLTVFGKKREQSSIPLAEKLKKELAEYKIFCEQWFGTQSEYVFTDADNRQLTPNAVKCVFKRLKEIMNFKDVRLSAHTFRHTFAHRMLMAGCDVFTLQKMLRHSSIEMTQKYLSLWGIALKEQNEKFNPLNNLDI